MSLSPQPPYEKWDAWVEYDPRAWPQKVAREHVVVPTLCFNCEAGCGLISVIDKQTLEIKRIEGNPLHPGSRGHTCAKGPATLAQVQDPERILKPMRRDGPRGSGRWREASWEEALADIGGRIRTALQAGRRDAVMYHVGRPGEDGFIARMLQCWGVDGYNTHTNVCSSSARLGYMTVWGGDRCSPDYAQARFILLISAKLESGHYFNPHAQRIIAAKEAGAEVAVLDIRLSNTASAADHWLPTRPGSEAEVLLAMAGVMCREGLIDRRFVERWTNWRETAAHLPVPPPEGPDPAGGATPLAPDCTFEQFLSAFTGWLSREYTLERAARASGVPEALIAEVARKAGRAGSRLCTHVWRNAASGNLGGWAVSRALLLLNVLTGSIGTPGGVAPNEWHKAKAAGPPGAPAGKAWNELLFPREFPLSHYEVSPLLPHLLLDGRGTLDVYFTRVFNPVWTYPDGATWIEALSREDLVGCHVALTPTWNETAQFADWVLPMGHGPERHDHQSQETHAGRWIGLRQNVRREAMRRLGQPVHDSREANPGEVWEEAEFFLRLAWEIDPQGELGIRRWFETPTGQPMTVEDYYRATFASVPGLEAAARAEGLADGLEYMRRKGAFALEPEASRYGLHEQEVGPDKPGVEIEGVRRAGFDTPSRRLELWSQTLVDWGWPEHGLPSAPESQVDFDRLAPGEIVLVPTFRLPVLIHSRSGNAKWLLEIAHSNPLWIHPDDAARLGVQAGALVKVSTRIGSFVLRAWPTEGIRPGVVAVSHHLGRWRKEEQPATNRWSAVPVRFQRDGQRLLVRRTGEIGPFASDDPDSSRLWWKETGVHQNMTFPVQPDPLSGMHCWHQVVRLEPAGAEDREGDVRVDLDASRAVYKEWMAMCRPAPGPGGLRRPLWLKRPQRPTDDAFRLAEA